MGAWGLKNKQVSQGIMGLSLLAFAWSGWAMADGIQADHISHAKELLGKDYRRIVLNRMVQMNDFSSWIEQQVESSFQGKWKQHAPVVAKALIEESKKHKFDPVFLMAVIQNESSFNPTVRGTSGEIGLMQILPSTGQWVAKRIGMKWEGEKTLSDPVKNIRLGSAYMALLRGQFDAQGGLYLAAYNMGAKNVHRALKKDIRPKDYAIRVMQRYIRFYGQLPSGAVGSGRFLASAAQ